MSIKKQNRKRTRRCYNFIDFKVRGFCNNWFLIKKAVRKMFPKFSQVSAFLDHGSEAWTSDIQRQHQREATCNPF